MYYLFVSVVFKFSFNINKTNNDLSISLNEHKIMTMKYDVAHSCPGMGQAQKCGGVKLITGILLITGSPIYKLTIA